MPATATEQPIADAQRFIPTPSPLTLLLFRTQAQTDQRLSRTVQPTVLAKTVVAFADAAHRRLHARFATTQAERKRRIPKALIEIMNHTTWPPFVPQPFSTHRAPRRAQVRRHPPSYHPPAPDIQHADGRPDPAPDAPRCRIACVDFGGNGSPERTRPRHFPKPRPVRNCLASRRCRWISEFSCVVRTTSRVPRSRSACATQLRVVYAEGSNSRANSLQERPARTRSTICYRHSCG